MSFLKDFKEDLSQAVNEIADEEEKKAAEKAAAENASEDVTENASENEDLKDEEMVNTLDESETETSLADNIGFDAAIDEAAPTTEDSLSVEDSTPYMDNNTLGETERDNKMDSVENNNENVVSDEITEITSGTVITGNIESSGSINILGKVNGDITCLGKLTVTGNIVGTSTAAEVFANSAKIDGDVISEGSVKIGNGTVIIGNVSANSAVIGGAVKGDIDVHGPVIVDTTAVVKGNIKSRSVQINNGAVIEGFCSQCYADVDYASLFDDTFTK